MLFPVLSGIMGWSNVGVEIFGKGSCVLLLREIRRPGPEFRGGGAGRSF